MSYGIIEFSYGLEVHRFRRLYSNGRTKPVKPDSFPYDDLKGVTSRWKPLCRTRTVKDKRNRLRLQCERRRPTLPERFAW